jgi:hypothetical protein
VIPHVVLAWLLVVVLEAAKNLLEYESNRENYGSRYLHMSIWRSKKITDCFGRAAAA